MVINNSWFLSKVSRAGLVHPLMEDLTVMVEACMDRLVCQYHRLESHQIQDDGTGIQGGRWNCPCLPPSVGQATHPSSIPSLNYLSWTSGTAIAKSKQRSISKVTTFLCFGTSHRKCRYEIPFSLHFSFSLLFNQIPPHLLFISQL